MHWLSLDAGALNPALAPILSPTNTVTLTDDLDQPNSGQLCINSSTIGSISNLIQMKIRSWWNFLGKWSVGWLKYVRTHYVCLSKFDNVQLMYRKVSHWAVIIYSIHSFLSRWTVQLNCQLNKNPTRLYSVQLCTVQACRGPTFPSSLDVVHNRLNRGSFQLYTFHQNKLFS